MIVLPSLPHDDYLRVNLACDAMLDTLHWSGGNTTLDALACGLPVVTLPGEFMRGRQSAAMLRMAGAEALIAADPDDYVRIASRLVDDAAWRNGMAGTIREGRDALFDRREPVQAFASYCSRCADQCIPDVRNHRAPIADTRLAEKPCARVPRRAIAGDAPAPVGRERKHHAGPVCRARPPGAQCWCRR